MHKHFVYLVPVLALIAFSLPTRDYAKGEGPPPLEKLDRAQTLVYNLNHVQGSSGYYLLDSIKQLKGLDHELGKALFQLKEVDKTYARLRGQPDDRFFETTRIKIEKAQQTREQLETDIADAYTQLKTTIQDTLITDPERKRH